MKMMLDCSPAKIFEYRERYGDDIWQLRTPRTAYARAQGVPYGLENGCFGGGFDEATWDRLLVEADSDRPVFVTLPDIVGCAQRTDELFEHFRARTQELPRALVIQDGIERVRVRWNDIVAVFIGGTDRFKYSPEAMRVAETAKMMGKWVHVGRVNTAARLRNWMKLGDSFDGSGVSRYDHMLEDCVAVMRGEHPQIALEKWA